MAPKTRRAELFHRGCPSKQAGGRVERAEIGGLSSRLERVRHNAAAAVSVCHSAGDNLMTGQGAPGSGACTSALLPAENLSARSDAQPAGETPVVFGKRFERTTAFSLPLLLKKRGPWRGGAFHQFPLSPTLSPLVPRGEREAKRRRRFACRTEMARHLPYFGHRPSPLGGEGAPRKARGIS